MRKLSWMTVIVLVSGGFFGVTRFAGMWGSGSEGSGEIDSLAARWQFERPGESDDPIGARALTDEGLRFPEDLWGEESVAVSEPEEVHEPVVITDLQPAAAVEMDLGAMAGHDQAIGSGQRLGGEADTEVGRGWIYFDDEIDAAVSMEAGLEPEAAAVSVTVPDDLQSEAEPESFWMDTEPAGDVIELPVAEAETKAPTGGELVATMSVMAADAGIDDWPREEYEAPSRTYVVSPQIAWAGDRPAMREQRWEETPSRSRPEAGNGVGGLGAAIDLTYVSRFIWRGYDIYENNHSAFQPSIDLDLFGTGFGVNVWMSRANGSGFEDSEWLTFTGYYGGELFSGELHAMAFRVGYRYYSYPDAPRRGNPLIRQTAEAQEIFGYFAWPNLLPCGIVPEYSVFAYWPSVSGSTARGDAGWGHLFGVSKDISFGSIFGNQPEQVVRLGAHAFYNGGFGPAGKAADHDWSHAVFSISTEFDLGGGFIFSPGFNYQSSWDDSVNTSDEYWTSLSVRYQF